MLQRFAAGQKLDPVGPDDDLIARRLVIGRLPEAFQGSRRGQDLRIRGPTQHQADFVGDELAVERGRPFRSDHQRQLVLLQPVDAHCLEPPGGYVDAGR